MLEEEAIFLLQSRVDQIRRDAIEWNEDAIFLIAAQGETEEFAVSIEDAAGKAHAIEEWRLGETKPGDAGDEGKDAAGKEGRFPNRPHKPGAKRGG
jgi:hypothetical protein